MLAKTLKEKALQVNKEAIKNRANKLVGIVTLQATMAANEGNYFIEITLKKGPKYWTEEEARITGEVLSKEGFVCSIKEDTTAYYSNIDYDSETVLRVSWE